MLNKCQFIGRLGADPEVRTTQSGARVVNLRLAVSERWKNANGEQQERTEWLPVVIWNERLGEVAEKYLSKGKQCFIEGQWQTRKFTDNSGQERYTTELVLQKFRGEIVLLDRREGGDAPAASAPRAAPRSSGGHAGGPPRGRDLDDEIPFGPCRD